MLLLIAASGTACGNDIGSAPWDFNHYTERDEITEVYKQSRAGEGPFPVRVLQKVFQAVSEVDGDRCPMAPTCSTYSIQALKKHGIAAGWVMTVDRLIRELDEQDIAPVTVVQGEYRAYDPVNANDFWWRKE